MKKITLAMLIICCILISFAQALDLFVGTPKIKISEGGIDRVVENMPEDKANEYLCVISEEDEKYFWTSRENNELIPIKSGAFITLIATNGSGYIRIIPKAYKELTAITEYAEAEFDYVEHLLIGLSSVTYYGIGNTNKF
ncbi:MAG: hypothetical protein KKH83_05145 [Candidatus Margulisbacteria bacterium]|nr:hypothetical protein [Candidatus Margulisiibacteriota bacterium]